MVMKSEVMKSGGDERRVMDGVVMNGAVMDGAVMDGTLTHFEDILANGS